MRLEKTARGWSRVMTSDSGSFMTGRSPMKYGLHTVDRPDSGRYRDITMSGSLKAGPEGVEMKVSYGFRATMTARPGKGDELVDLLLGATTDGPAANDACVLFLVGRSASNRDVVHVTEGWTTQEAHATNFVSDRAKAFTARIAPLVGGEVLYQDDVPVGGRFRD